TTTHIYPPTLHDALPISPRALRTTITRSSPRGREDRRASLHGTCLHAQRLPLFIPAGPTRAGRGGLAGSRLRRAARDRRRGRARSEEHTSELQSPDHIVC